MKGKITYINSERGFLKIDNAYFSFISKLTFEPFEDMEVEFDVERGKKGENAINIKPLASLNEVSNHQGNGFEEYLKSLKTGYFLTKDNNNYIKEDFIILYPQILAKTFTKNNNLNKISTVEKYFTYCRTLEGQYKLFKDFNSVKTKLLELIPLVNRSANKTKPTVSKEFVNFIESNINLSVLSKENFIEGFLIHFQAIIGYYKN